MLVAFAIVRGFQREVREKIIGFGAHISIRAFDTNESMDQPPIQANREDVLQVASLQNVKAVYPFVEKGGLVKTDSILHGILMKGVDKHFDATFLSHHIVQGDMPNLQDSISNDILISYKVAQMLHLSVDSAFRVYFFNSGESMPRGRKFRICGIYNTGMAEFDKVYALCDMRHLQKMNGWGDSLVSGYEILVNDFNELDQTYLDVNQTIYYDLEATEITNEQSQFFDWLKLLDSNVIIILVLMTIVAVINIISIILILVLERIPMIGLLKAMGANNALIRKVFIIMSSKLLLRGLLWGNITGLGLLLLQQCTALFPLNEEMYYVDHIPVMINPLFVLGVNGGVTLVSIVAVLIPTLIIRRISPSAALQHK